MMKKDIITYEEIDHIAMEYLTKQKIKFLYVCGGEKEKIFITIMIKKFVRNHGFNTQDIKKLNDIFEEFNSTHKETNSKTI